MAVITVSAERAKDLRHPPVYITAATHGGTGRWGLAICRTNTSRRPVTARPAGHRTIYAVTAVRHPLRPELQDVVPYVSAVVEFDGTQGAGAWMTVNVVDCDPDRVAIGDKVRIRWEKVSDTFAVPWFVPI